MAGHLMVSIPLAGAQQPVGDVATLEQVRADTGASRLVERARRARAREILDLPGYDAWIRETVQVELEASGLRRPRSYLRQEGTSRLQWRPGGEPSVLPTGDGRRSWPLLELRGDRYEMEVPPMALEPGALGRLSLSGRTLLHPLGTEGGHHYLFSSGDTVHLPWGDSTRTLVEVRVRPRADDPRLVAASLWIDAETAGLVQLTAEPVQAVPWPMKVPVEELEGLPGMLPLPPTILRAEVDRITVRHRLAGGRWWLPAQVSASGRRGVVAGIESVLEATWTVEELQPLDGEGRVPPAGEARQAPGGREDDLASLPEADLRTTGPGRGLWIPTWSLAPVRYNRVEGLSVGATVEVDPGPHRQWTLTARIGVPSQAVDVGLEGFWGDQDGGWRVRLFRELRSMNDWDDPFGLPTSAVHLVLGSSLSEYLRATGLSLAREGGGRGGSPHWRLEGFHEDQGPVDKATGFFLLQGLTGDSVGDLIQADPGRVTGLRGRLGGYRGADPSRWILAGEMRGEIGRGDASYQRLTAVGSVRRPLGSRLDAGLEIGGGYAWGEDVPVQRTFLLGGDRTVRAFEMNQHIADSYARVRAELAGGWPALRPVLFTDAGWLSSLRDPPEAGPVEQEEVLLSAGGGLSVLDGIMRFELARALRGGDAWSVHVYFDGVF